MLDHIKIHVRDAARSRAFYERALVPLGYRVIMAPAPGVIGTKTRFPDLWLAESPAPTVAHIALRAEDPTATTSRPSTTRSGCRPHRASFLYAPPTRAMNSSVGSAKPFRRTSPMCSNSRCEPAASTTGRVTSTSPPPARAETRAAWLTSRP